MIKALFVNTGVKECGVYQYGCNLASILTRKFERISWEYCEPSSLEALHVDVIEEAHDVIVYNWQDGQGGYLAGAPFADLKCKQVLVFHDGAVAAGFDAILFSDPTMAPSGNWHPIGRPIPPRYNTVTCPFSAPIFGVHGFRGAWADRVVTQVLKEFEFATVRMLLPFSHYCDPSGAEAKTMAEQCRKLVAGSGITLDISHDFLPQPQLLEWLAGNHLNCYLRDPAWVWRGVSSAPDCALAVRRPIAVSKCNAFRHLHSTTPSICVEDSSLRDIIANGLTPLVPLYEQWSAERVREQVDNIILSL